MPALYVVLVPASPRRANERARGAEPWPAHTHMMAYRNAAAHGFGLQLGALNAPFTGIVTGQTVLAACQQRMSVEEVQQSDECSLLAAGSNALPQPQPTVAADGSIHIAAAYKSPEGVFVEGGGGHTCHGCNGFIHDQFVLHAADHLWHAGCLRCHECCLPLEQLQSCYVKQEHAYCKPCYTRQFGVKCARCGRQIAARDWVRRAKQLVYHLACFACDACKRQLSTGEHFALQECRVLCKQHYMELIEGESGKASKSKCKRVRTTFTEEQLQVLQANFQVDSNPDGQDLERIAQITGLSKRVTQVWFQNSRARQKKYQTLKHRPTSGNSPAGGPPIVSSVMTEIDQVDFMERSLAGSVYSCGDNDRVSSLDMSPTPSCDEQQMHTHFNDYEPVKAESFEYAA